MSKPQKFCIYCGGPGLSKEHVFADWLRDYIPRELTSHASRFVRTFPYKSNETMARKTGDLHARKVRRVCTTCNNGWMSALQEDAKPFLVPMLQGRPVSFDRHGQKILAAWVAMTTMTAEFLNEQMVSVPQSDRDYLRANGRAPKTWRIWVSQYERGTGAGRFWHNAMALTKEKVEGAALFEFQDSNSQTTTICVGDHLLFHAMSSSTVPDFIRRWRLPPALSGLFQQIYPAAAAKVSWPVGRRLSYSEVTYVSDLFYSRLVRAAKKAAFADPLAMQYANSIPK